MEFSAPNVLSGVICAIAFLLVFITNPINKALHPKR